MLPFSLAVIVLIFAVWQEITLSPQKEKLNHAIEFYKRLDEIERNNKCLLENPVKHDVKKYYLSQPAKQMRIDSIPRFPR